MSEAADSVYRVGAHLVEAPLARTQISRAGPFKASAVLLRKIEYKECEAFSLEVRRQRSMSTPGRIPVLAVDPKIEERLRRKREKQRVYDRRRREANGLTTSSTAAGSVASDTVLQCDADSGSDHAGVIGPRKVSKNKLGTLTARRHSTNSVYPSRLSKASPTADLSADLITAIDSSPGSKPALSISNPPYTFGDGLPTPQSGGASAAAAYTAPFQKRSPVLGGDNRIRDRNANGQFYMAYTQSITPISSTQHSMRGVLNPMPTGELADSPSNPLHTGIMQNPDLGSYQYHQHHHQQHHQYQHPHQHQHQHHQHHQHQHHPIGDVTQPILSPSSTVPINTNPIRVGPGISQQPVHPSSSTSFRSLSVPSTLYSLGDTTGSTHAMPRKSFIEGSSSLNVHGLGKQDSQNSHFDLLAADLGINTIDVTESNTNSASSNATIHSKGPRGRSPNQTFVDTGEGLDFRSGRSENPYRRGSFAAAGSGSSSGNASVSPVANQDAIFDSIFGLVGHPIVDPRFPEPVSLDLLGNESAYESVYDSVYESIYESAFEDESPPS